MPNLGEMEMDVMTEDSSVSTVLVEPKKGKKETKRNCNLLLLQVHSTSMKLEPSLMTLKGRLLLVFICPVFNHQGISAWMSLSFMKMIDS